MRATATPGHTMGCTPWAFTIEDGGGNIIAVVGLREPDVPELGEWEAEFEAAARRPLKARLRYAFIHTYKPVLDDAPYRSFDSMAEYRAWCERELPEWLGYGAAV